MHDHILRIASVTSQHMDDGLVVHGSVAVRWHQFNEETTLFPKSLIQDLSLENGLQFLTDGQSKTEPTR